MFSCVYTPSYRKLLVVIVILGALYNSYAVQNGSQIMMDTVFSLIRIFGLPAHLWKDLSAPKNAVYVKNLISYYVDAMHNMETH